jgi:hypothetical protein
VFNPTESNTMKRSITSPLALASTAERVDIGTDALDVRLRTAGLAAVAREMMARDMERAA